MMRRPLLAAVAALLTAAVAGAAVAGAAAAAPASPPPGRPLKIGVEGAYPPFSMTDAKGGLSGFDIDIANALCAAMQAKCELVPTLWDKIQPALLDGQIDAIVASMAITGERRKRFDFTDKYYHKPARFVRRAGSGIAITPAGLKGRRVGVQRGTIHDSFLTDRFGDVADIRRYPTQDEADRDMLAGKLDLVFADTLVLAQELVEAADARDRGKAKFEFAGPAYTDPAWFGEGAGIALRKGDGDLRARLNQALAAIRADGTYDKISRRYFAYDIYGS